MALPQDLLFVVALAHLAVFILDPMPTHDTRRYAIIGHPIGHSLSPLMYTTAFKAYGLGHTYETIDIEPANLKAGVMDIVEKGFSGFSVTIPHKQSVVEILDEVDPEAREIGAVNTVVIRKKRLKGFNTDIDGVVGLLSPFESNINGKNVLILGAGGAARAVVYALSKQFKPATVIIAARAIERGRQMRESFKPQSCTVIGFSENELRQGVEESSVVINATPLGMHPKVRSSPLPESCVVGRHQVVIDLIYRPLETTLMENAKRDGATVVGGVEMLLQQGARAFEIWTGYKMEVAEVREALMRRLRENNDK